MSPNNQSHEATEQYNISQIAHTRHRSPVNFLVNFLAALIAYTWQPNKPSINLTEAELAQFPAVI